MLGSATNSVGSHMPENIGLGAVTYHGADQITMEKVSRVCAHNCITLTYYRALARVPLRSHANHDTHDLKTFSPVLLPTGVPRQVVRYRKLDSHRIGNSLGYSILHSHPRGMRYIHQGKFLQSWCTQTRLREHIYYSSLPCGFRCVHGFRDHGFAHALSK